MPRKGQAALHVPWTAPLVLTSNHMPDYANTGGNLGRRLVTFKFERTVSAPQEDLLDRIMAEELPSVACRFLRAYHAQRQRAAAAGAFWRAVPARVIGGDQHAPPLPDHGRR